MKIAIVGTGGVGGYFGGKLARSGHDVIFVARGTHLQAIKTNGLQVKSINGDFVVKQAKVTDNIKDIGTAELIILGVKAWQVKEIAGNLNEIIDNDTLVLPLQNGVLAAEELAGEINPDHILGGLCRIMSKIDSPGVINHFGIEPAIVFGELNKVRTLRVEKIRELLDQAGIKGTISNDIHADLWRKFIAICVGGLLAVTRSDYGTVRMIKETRTLMYDLLKEIYMISQKAGINVEPEYVDKTMSVIDSFPYDSSSSMARDIWEGKPSELDYQNGTAVKLGEKYGVDTPINRFIYSCILPMELRARGLSSRINNL